MTEKEAMKLALEALEYIEHNYMSLPAPAEKAITSLREALAEQPAQQQEPVAWRYTDARGHYRYRGFVANFDKKYPMLKPQPLCTSPIAQRTWVGLTPEQAVDLYKATETDNRMVLIDAVEAKLRSKNEDRN